MITITADRQKEVETFFYRLSEDNKVIATDFLKYSISDKDNKIVSKYQLFYNDLNFHDKSCMFDLLLVSLNMIEKF